jgi:membrane protein DedA with SNARE-associated domain
MERYFLDLLARHGAPMLFAAQMLGIFGIPIPDEVLLTVAGALVRRGTLSATSTVVCAVAGCIAGISLSYFVGRTVGVPTLRRLLGPHSDSLERAQIWFERFGKWVLAFGYFIPGVRHATAIAAGSSRFEFSEFAAYAYPGAVLWSTTFVAAGYYGGDRWEHAAALARGHLAAVAIAAVAAAAAYAYARRREKA